MKKHSVTLDVTKCRGCTSCLQICPTQAIRIRKGKAVIISESCIDCGECVKICPNNAKTAKTNTIEEIRDSPYRYKAALVAPSVLGQFGSSYTTEQILSMIKNVGFDYVFEVAVGAELVGRALRYELADSSRRLTISSACPAVAKLICARFPELVDAITPLKAPITVCAELYAKKLCDELGAEPSELGFFFITPCAAKTTEIFNEADRSGIIRGAVSVIDIYHEIMKNGRPKTVDVTPSASPMGLRWAVSGGEAAYLNKRDTLHVSGIKNILKCLEDIDLGRLSSVKYIEMLACTEGCVGGCLTVESPFVAKREIQLRADEISSDEKVEVITDADIEALYRSGALTRENPFEPAPPIPLSEDRARAIEMVGEIDEILDSLPGFDCGSCGAPGCAALAEDIVRGSASKLDCIFILKDTLAKLSQDMLNISHLVVPLMSGDDPNSDKTKGE